MSAERESRTALPAELLSSLQQGTLRTRYRGRRFLKSPFDVVLYLQLLQQLKPRTVIEIGSNEGGAALWLADMLELHGIDGRVITIDLAAPSGLDSRIEVLPGDANDLGKTLSAEFIAGLRHPLLVIEDSAHVHETCLRVLRFFDRHLQRGDYIVIEDGIVAFMPEERYRAYDAGPTRAVAQFLRENPGKYEIDAALCDFFGLNVTYNPNGWLRRLQP
jgi:cephalosporin hydroxylase